MDNTEEVLAVPKYLEDTEHRDIATTRKHTEKNSRASRICNSVAILPSSPRQPVAPLPVVRQRHANLALCHALRVRGSSAAERHGNAPHIHAAEHEGDDDIRRRGTVGLCEDG